MVPAQYVPFFTTCATAGAALIGLLFVAVSVAPQRIVTREAPVEQRAFAVSTFTALVNAFFVSLLGLVPAPSLGPTAIIGGIAALVNTAVVGAQVVPRWSHWTSALRGGFLLALSCVVYGVETYQGIVLTRDSHSTTAITALAFLIVCAYAIGLQRAWQLLGGRDAGFLSWLTQGREVREGDEAPRLAADADPGRTIIAAPTPRRVSARPDDTHPSAG